MKIQPLHEVALNYGLNSKGLNPANEGQSRISVYAGKPIRAIARFFYGFGCTTVIPTCGAFYHLGKAIDTRLMAQSSKNEEEIQQLRAKSWEHLKAAGKDALMAISSIFLAIVVIQLANFSSKVTDADRFGLLLGFCASAGASALIVPFSFAILPHEAEKFLPEALYTRYVN